jgi:hypothetical protein
MKNNDYNYNDEPNFPLDNNGKNPFGLPADYFSTFEDKLKQKMELKSELSEFPLLSSIQKTNVFTAPADYFQSAKNSLEYTTELTSYPKLEAVKVPVFAELTEDYKKEFQSVLNYKIELADELKAYATLYNLDKTNAFSVPENYFDTVASQVKERIHAVNHSKASVLDTVLDFILGKKLALSFGLVLIIGLSVYFNQPAEPVVNVGDCKTLACLERQEILNDNKVISNLDEDQLMDLVDINSLNDQLNSGKQKTTKSTIQKNDLDSVNEDDLLDQL